MNKLIIINDALIATGNVSLNVEYDGSEEWKAADSAYRRAVQYLLDKHHWKFATTTAPLVGRALHSPHPRFVNAYTLPADCLHVVSAYVGGRGLTEYEILDNLLCCAFDQGVVVKYVRVPDNGVWPAGFVELVTMKIEEYLLRGLNEDDGAADRRARDVLMALAEERTATDQQEPPKAMFRSRSAARRAGAARRTRFNGFPYDGVP